MPNGLKNWSYLDAVKFLKKKKFVLARKKGSHEMYKGFIQKEIKIVTVPFHGRNSTIKPRTMKSIIAQSGIDQKKWLD